MEAPAMAPPVVTNGAPPLSDNVAPANNESEKRRRQPRNSACKPCAELKMRCVTGGEPGKCERCHRMNRVCIPSVPKPRKRRAKSVVGADPVWSVSLSGLAESTPTTETIEYLPESTRQKPYTFQNDPPATALSLRTDVWHTVSKSFAAVLARGLRSDPLTSPNIDALEGVDANFVHTSFTIFRQISGHFPFISVARGADPFAMARQRPLMTLAVCAVTSAAFPALQERLRQAGRLALASKAIVEGERSMDLFLALLITIVWHHHYMAKQQIYQNLCLVAGMAADLGFYHLHDQNETQYSAAMVERDRAFLGCYYICALLSVKAFSKPNPLRWTDDIRKRAENVARTGTLPSDRTLASSVELAHVLDDLNATFPTDTRFNPQVFASFVEMHASYANHRLQSLKRDHPSLSSNTAFAAAIIDIHQKRLGAGINTDPSALIQCACSIREYLDDLLARPPIIMHHMTIIDWSNLLSILILMAVVSESLPSADGWETGALTSMLPADDVLDTVATHMANAPQGDQIAPRNEALLQWFQSFCEDVKREVVHGQSSHDNCVAAMTRNGILDESFLSNFVRPP